MTTQDRLHTAGLPRRGRLRLFAGYAPGVGKTRAMLAAAQLRLAAGQTGLAVELDPPPALEGLETIAAFDLDAILARRPDLVLVGCLARTNPPGARHTARYQDVLELLEAGLDVYAPLNIYHLSGLTDAVNRITGQAITPTVPDRIFDDAEAVELVDLPPDDLLQRLHTGQFRIPAPFDEKFFRPGNLLALQELTLRRMADRIDSQLRHYMQNQQIAGPWPVAERLLVCVGPSPLGARLIQTTRRLAAGLNTDWFAVHVETPDSARLSPADRTRLAHNLQLAETMGARTVTLTGSTVAEAVTDFARSHNIAKIVVGKPLHSRWRQLWRGSIVDQIVRHSGNLDIYVINSAAERSGLDLPCPAAFKPVSQGWSYLWSVGLVLSATLLGYPLRPIIEPTNLVMIYLLVVVIAALRLGRAPAIVASVLSVIAFNFVFVPPYHTYAVTDAQFLLTFAGLLTVGIVISALAAQAREQAQAARRRAAQTLTLYEFNRDLAAASSRAGIVTTLTERLTQTFQTPPLVLLSTQTGLQLQPEQNASLLSPAEQEAATWVFQHGQPAGRGTQTFAGHHSLYVPLLTGAKTMGALALPLEKNAKPFSNDQVQLIESLAGQAAQAMERLQLAQEARQAQLLRETEKLQTALLNSISHDLRTPLASITGALSSLRDDAPFLDEAARTVLVDTAWEQADRLNNLVGNLLQMTRLEAGGIRIKPEPGDIQDLIGVTLAQMGHRLDERPVNLEIPDTLPLIPLDMVLMVQALVNLLDNALKYSPPHQPITCRVEPTDTEVHIQVIDNGPGIPDRELERIFTKFYRLAPIGDAGGTGLGLSISKGIVEAHHGRIWAENRPEGGAAFTIALPLAPGEDG